MKELRVSRNRLAIGTLLLLLMPLAIPLAMPIGIADDVAPSATPTETTATLAISPLAAYVLPATQDRLVPGNLKPSLAKAKMDRPTPYLDHCHTQQNLTASTEPCVYGEKKSKTTIVLFGDSHALSWFPAIEALAFAKKWRMLSLTMSSCWPADIPAWNSTTQLLMKNCAIWRGNTLKQIAKIKPTLIFVSGTRGFSTTNSTGDVSINEERANLWEAGMKRTLAKLKLAGSRVVLLSDTPLSIYDVPECLSKHPSSILACSTPIDKALSLGWLAREADVAANSEVEWINPTLWVCPSDPCSPISKNILIYIDGGHLSATFAHTLEAPLWKEVSKN